jgi:glycosyltransferase involved in cell wall biosynthesis
MPSVLVIAHSFPPVSGVGVRRTLAFVRYLPAQGWQPVVLTVRRPLDGPPDEALAALVPSTVRVVRTPWVHPRLVSQALRRRSGRSAGATDGSGRAAGPPGRLRIWLRALLWIPDQAVGWWPFAVAAGLRELRRGRIRAIYSTSGPPTSHLVAWTLKRLARRPWVADFRDPWTADLASARRQMYALRWRYRLDRRLERHVLAAADRVVAVSEPQRRVLLAAAGEVESARFRVITNGYDPDDWVGLTRRAPDRFTITYTGTFYLAEQSPAPFLEALAGLVRAGPVGPGEVRLRILGPSAQPVQAAAAAAGVPEVVSATGPVSHRTALQAQLDASVLLLVRGPAQGRQGVLTGKLFEYLAARRPILALVPPDSAVADILRAAEAGPVVAPADHSGITAALRRLVEEFRASGDVRWRGREEVVQAFARPRLAAQLADLLNEIVPPDEARH